MKKSINKKASIAMAAAALCMVAGLSIGGTSAYFTTYVSAGGSQTVSLGAQTKIQEEVSDMTKHISVKNTSQMEDCFVRVKLFYGNGLTVTCTDRSESGGLWNYSEADGYWYYAQPLAAGASTEILDAKIEVPDGFDRAEFNVVVIQECTPVIYDDNNRPSADWSAVYTEYQDTADAGSTVDAKYQQTADAAGWLTQGEEADRA